MSLESVGFSFVVHRFYLPAAAWDARALALGEAEAHHAINVLRLRAGERVVVFDGAGREATAEIQEGASKRAVPLKVLHTQQSPELSCRLTLGQAIPKGKNMDLIIQKATELGAAEIQPLLSERTVARCDDAGDAAAKQEKWQQVAVEAAKQCGQNWLPTIGRPRSPKDFLAERARDFDLLLIASLQPDARHPRVWLREHAAPRRALILIGPEGDFTPAEIAQAKAAGCHPITLGPIILRTETAALYCLSVLSYELLNRE